MFQYIFCFIFFLVTYIQLCIRVEFYYVKLQVLFCSIQVLLTVKFYQPCVMHPQLEKVRKSHNSSVKCLFSSLLKMRFSQPSSFQMFDWVRKLRQTLEDIHTSSKYDVIQREQSNYFEKPFNSRLTIMFLQELFSKTEIINLNIIVTFLQSTSPYKICKYMLVWVISHEAPKCRRY